jgi:hypothetical protein
MGDTSMAESECIERGAVLRRQLLGDEYGWTEQELVEVLLFFTVPGRELLDRPFNMRRPAVHIHGHLGSRTLGAAPSPECWDG